MRGTFIELNGINFNESGSFALINNKFLAEGDTVVGALKVVKIGQDHVILATNEKEYTLQTSSYLILDQGEAVAAAERATLFSAIVEKLKFKK